MARAPVVLSFALVLALPGAAAAHPLVDEAARRYQIAEFEAALEFCAQAREAEDLTREELAKLYELEALVHTALGSDDDAAASLRNLAAFAPDHDVDPTAPPEFREAFVDAVAAVGGSLRVEASATRDADAVQVDGWVDSDPTRMVREVRVFGRSGDEWLGPAINGLRVPAPASAAVEYYAEAIGPGGAVIGTAGTRDAPRRSGDASAAEESGDAGDEGPDWLIIGLGAGAAVLVATIVVVAVAATPADDTILEGPFFESGT